MSLVQINSDVCSKFGVQNIPALGRHGTQSNFREAAGFAGEARGAPGFPVSEGRLGTYAKIDHVYNEYEAFPPAVAGTVERDHALCRISVRAKQHGHSAS